MLESITIISRRDLDGSRLELSKTGAGTGYDVMYHFT
jgi:hypothetical protein